MIRTVVLGLCVLAGPLTAQDAATALRRAERAYQDLETLRARFEQTIVNPMLGDPETAEGVLYLAPPDRFAMRFSRPAGDRIVADGRWLWAYTPTTVPDQVIRQPIPQAGSTTPNLMGQFVERPLARYEPTYLGADVIRGDSVDLVRLVPKRNDLPFRRAEIAVARAGGLLRRIVIQETSRQTRTLVFHDLTVNATIPAAEFRFDVPPGTRVVTPD